MSNYHEELLLEIINNWDDARLLLYIQHLEERMDHTKTLLTELRGISRKRSKKKNIKDTGARDGR